MFVRFFNFGRFAFVISQFHARALGKFLQRFFEIQSLFFHHELKNIAALVARAITFPCSQLGPDDERGRALVVVEGTKARITASRFAELYARLGYEVYDIYLGFNFISGRHGNQ